MRWEDTHGITRIALTTPARLRLQVPGSPASDDDEEGFRSPEMNNDAEFVPSTPGDLSTDVGSAGPVASAGGGAARLEQMEHSLAQERHRNGQLRAALGVFERLTAQELRRQAEGKRMAAHSVAAARRWLSSLVRGAAPPARASVPPLTAPHARSQPDDGRLAEGRGDEGRPAPGHAEDTPRTVRGLSSCQLVPFAGTTGPSRQLLVLGICPPQQPPACRIRQLVARHSRAPNTQGDEAAISIAGRRKYLPTHRERAALFDRMDVKGNGALSLAEMDKAVVELWPRFNHKAALMRAYTAADTNDDGLITWQEFESVLTHVLYYNALWPKLEQVENAAVSRFRLQVSRSQRSSRVLR